MKRTPVTRDYSHRTHHETKVIEEAKASNVVDREVMLRILEKLIEKEPGMIVQARMDALVSNAWHAAKQFEVWAKLNSEEP